MPTPARGVTAAHPRQIEMLARDSGRSLPGPTAGNRGPEGCRIHQDAPHLVQSPVPRSHMTGPPKLCHSCHAAHAGLVGTSNISIAWAVVSAVMDAGRWRAVARGRRPLWRYRDGRMLEFLAPSRRFAAILHVARGSEFRTSLP